MILSFPNMGPNWVGFKTLFETLDPSIRVIVPDPTNREAIKIGVKYSPEFVCFQFKATLGDFVNAIRRKLGEMGVEIHQNLSLWDWVSHKFHLDFHRRWLEHLSRPYVPMDIGGECQ